MRIQEIDSNINLLQAVLWQYNNADNIKTLAQGQQDYVDENNKQFWEDWYNDVFNLVTANEFGLSVWSIILNVPFLMNIFPQGGKIFGFNQLPVVNENVNFERGNFAKSKSRIILTLEDQRIFLRCRYFQLISRGSVIDTNNFLDLLFNDPLGPYQGGAWVIDNLDMTSEYVFNTDISANLLAALEEFDILPRPTGVELSYTVL